MATQPKPCVLIVEDDDSVASVERIALEEDHEVVMAQSVSAAKAALAVLQVDVVVLDWRLGRECGRELLEALPKQQGLARPLTIVCTGDTSGDEALKLGALFVLTKPFQMKELREAVQRAVNAR